MGVAELCQARALGIFGGTSLEANRAQRIEGASGRPQVAHGIGSSSAFAGVTRLVERFYAEKNLGTS